MDKKIKRKEEQSCSFFLHMCNIGFISFHKVYEAFRSHLYNKVHCTYWKSINIAATRTKYISREHILGSILFLRGLEELLNHKNPKFTWRMCEVGVLGLGQHSRLRGHSSSSGGVTCLLLPASSLSYFPLANSRDRCEVCSWDWDPWAVQSSTWP